MFYLLIAPVPVAFLLLLYVNGSRSITSVGEERSNLSAVVYL